MTIPDNNEPQNEPQGQGQDSGTAANEPPYAAYLNEFPDSLRGTAENVFKKWDQSVGERFQKVHSDYEPYKAYEPFVKNQVPVEELEQAYSILTNIRTDPKAVWDQLGEAMGYNQPVAEQGPVGDDSLDEGDFNTADVYAQLQKDPRFAGQEELVRTMADFIVSQQQEKVQLEAQSQVDQEITALRANHAYDEGDLSIVLTLAMQNNLSMEDAATMYDRQTQARMNALRAPTAPKILGGGGGGIPAEPVIPSKMDSKQTKNMVMEYLKNANQEG